MQRSLLLGLALLGCQGEDGSEATDARIADLEAEVADLQARLAAQEAAAAGLATEAWVEERLAAEVADAVDAALASQGVATEAWVEAGFATPTDVDAAVDAALTEGAVATEAWVAANYATPGAVGQAIDAALPDGALATETWVAANYATPVAVGQAIDAALPDGAVATETWVAANYATPGAVGTAIDAALPDGPLATETWVAAGYATPGDIDDALDARLPAGALATEDFVTSSLDAALPEGPVASEAWVGERFLSFEGIGFGLTLDGTTVEIDVAEVEGLATDVAFDNAVELKAALDGHYVARHDGDATDLVVSGSVLGCDGQRLGAIEYRAGNFYGCAPEGWELLGGIGYGGSAESAALSCRHVKDARPTSPSGLYWVDLGQGTAVQTWCDMDTDGGGWTLVGWSYMASIDTHTSNDGFRSLRCGGGTWAPEARGTGAAAIDATELVARSNEIAFSMNLGGGTVATGGLRAYDRAWKFTIPDPSKVHFNSHSYMGPNWNTGDDGVGPCVPVTVVGIHGDSGTYARYTLAHVLGTSWSDSFPTGYGAADTSTCINHDGGPFLTSIHSGHGQVNPHATITECDVVDGTPDYAHRGNYTPSSRNHTGSAAIWLR